MPGLAKSAEGAVAEFLARLDEHQRHVRQYGEDMPEIQGWKWPYEKVPSA
jgi:xylulose-5-phosphate/fructose-6-phosphate phosphoketolase